MNINIQLENISSQFKNIDAQFGFISSQLKNNSSLNIQAQIFIMAIQLFNTGIQMVNFGNQMTGYFGIDIINIKSQIQNIGFQIQNLGNQINMNNINNNMMMNMNNVGIQNNNMLRFDNIQNEEEEWLEGFKMGVEVVYEKDKSEGPKKNIFFTTSNGNRINLTFNYGTTIDSILKKYLLEINKPELINNTDKVSFLFNATKLNFGDNTPIEKKFLNTDYPKIVVNTLRNINI